MHRTRNAASLMWAQLRLVSLLLAAERVHSAANVVRSQHVERVVLPVSLRCANRERALPARTVYSGTAKRVFEE
jgi:hypothetical protein